VRIAVFGHVGNQNLGDEALVAAVLENVRARYPEADLYAFTSRPGDTEQRHHVPAFPVRHQSCLPPTGEDRGSNTGNPGWPARFFTWWREVSPSHPRLRGLARRIWALVHAARALPRELIFLARSYRRLQDTDVLLFAGSAQLSDYWGGPWGFPFTVFKWSLLARLCGARVAFLSMGAGPLETSVGRFFIRQALRLAHYRSYRDGDSRQCILDLGVRGEHPVVPDLVFSLATGPAAAVAPSPRRIVGINPMPVWDGDYWPRGNPAAYARYLTVLASFADWLSESGYQVQFFGTQLVVDPGAIDRVRKLMSARAAAASLVLTPRTGSIAELLAAIDGFDWVVATRYHGTLFSLICQKPVISIAYQAKSVALMRQVGLGEYALDFGDVTLEALRNRFVALAEHEAATAETLRENLPAIRRVLRTQYDRALDPGSAHHAKRRGVQSPRQDCIARAAPSARGAANPM
jgi:polysaccharide pyruvyl transferase WcaK-like protein